MTRSRQDEINRDHFRRRRRKQTRLNRYIQQQKAHASKQLNKQICESIENTLFGKGGGQRVINHILSRNSSNT